MMKRIFFFGFLMVAAVASAANISVNLWPDGQMPHPLDSQAATTPHIEWFDAPTTGDAQKPCMILISGGAYGSLSDIARCYTWKDQFTALGFRCVLLVYRTPRPEGLPIYQTAWEDAQRAVRIIRRDAATYGIDPNRIGAVGMSAGSHLATLLATSSMTNVYDRIDETDDISPRINVALAHSIAYGMTDGLTGENTGTRGYGAELDSVFQFDAQTCPMCMTHGEEDPYTALSATHVWRKLREKGVMTELHLYAGKRHDPLGFDRHVEFLRKLGWLGTLPSAESPLVRWPDDSARASVVDEPLYPEGGAGGPVVEWHLPTEFKTGAAQIILVGPDAATDPVSTAITAARRYLNATGMAVITAQIRAESSLADTRRAVALVRGKAAEYGLNPSYVGVMAFGSDVTNAVAAGMVQSGDSKPKWVVSISPRNLDVGDYSFHQDWPSPTLFLHAENDAVAGPLASVEVWEEYKRLWSHGSLHTFAGETENFVASSVPGTDAYGYLNRIREFLSDKNYLVAWTEPEPEDDPDPVEPDPEIEIATLPWFDVQFLNSAFVAGADWIAQSTDPAGGVFAAATGVESELVKSTDEAHVSFVEDKEGVISYTPSASPSGAGTNLVVNGRAMVESMQALPASDATAKAGICFIGGYPYGYANGTWTKIGTTRLTEGAWVDYEIELDFTSDAAPSVRYTIGGSVGEWLPLASGTASIQRARFLSGSFGDFKGEYSYVVEEEPEEPEEIPVYALTIPAKEGLTLVSVETNGVAVAPAGGVYSVYSNAQVTVTFAAASGYELTGSGTVVLTIDGNKTLGESDYPESQIKPVLDYWVYDSTAKTLTWGANVVSNVTVSGKNLTIGNNQANPLAVDLDFSKTIDGDYQLVKISGTAFENSAAVTRFIAPASLKTIEWNAFKTCANLTTVDLNEGLTSLGNEAFRASTGLTTIGHLPSTLTSCGNNTFFGCTSLTGDLVWPVGIKTYNVNFNNTRITSLDLSSVTNLSGSGAGPFSGCSALTNIVIGAEIEVLSKATVLGDLSSGDPIHVWWHGVPTDVVSKIFQNSNNGRIVNHFDYAQKAEWEALAEALTGTYTIVLPATFDGQGSWTDIAAARTQTIEWFGEPVDPIDYQRVEYIESTGAQYIDTGYVPNENTRIEAEFAICEYADGRDREYVFGCYDGSRSPETGRIQFAYGSQLGLGYSTTFNTQYVLPKDNGIHLVTLAPNGTFTVDATNTFWLSTAWAGPSTNLYLFGVDNAGTASATQKPKERIYSFDIYEGDRLVHSYEPVVANVEEEEVVAFYDEITDRLVEAKYFGDAVPLVAGPVVSALKIPAKEGLAIASVTTNGVPVRAAHDGYLVEPGAEVTVTFAAAESYQLTGSGTVVRTIDGDTTFGDDDYPGVAILEDTATYTWKSTVAEGDWTNPANWDCSVTGTIGYPNYLNTSTGVGPIAEFASTAIVHLPANAAMAMKTLRVAAGCDVKIVGEGANSSTIRFNAFDWPATADGVRLVFDNTAVNMRSANELKGLNSLLALDHGAIMTAGNKLTVKDATSNFTISLSGRSEWSSTAASAFDFLSANGRFILDDSTVTSKYNFNIKPSSSSAELIVKGAQPLVKCGTGILNGSQPISVVLEPSIETDPNTALFQHATVGGNKSSSGMFFGRDGTTFVTLPVTIGVDAEALAAWKQAACEAGGLTNDYLIADWNSGGILTNMIELAELDGNNYFYYGYETYTPTDGNAGIYKNQPFPTKLYLHLEQSAELSFATPTVAARGTTATVSVELAAIGPDATFADVYFAYGTDAEALDKSVLVKSSAVAGEALSVPLSGLKPETTYYYAFYATNNLLETAEVAAEFMTKPLEQLVLENAKAAAATKSAELRVTLVTVGENATSAAVAVAWGEAEDELCDPVLVADAATAGEIVSYAIEGLEANTQYFLEFSATNNLGTVATLASSFKTPDPSVARSAHDFYPTNTTGSVLVPDGYAVTYYAEDAAKPYHVIPEDNCTFVYTSTVTKAGLEYKFFSESDFEANATARIGDTYYLFLSDAIDAAKSGNAIELLKDNNFVAKQMVISFPLTINGNGYTVKVKDPYVGENGFINTNCTKDVRNLFLVQNGGDVEMYDMTIMGGGNAKEFDIGTTYWRQDSAIAVNAGGCLKLANVTLTRSNGGLVTETGSRVLIDKCQIVRNCRFCGGGIYNRGVIVMNDSSLSENRSTGYYDISKNKFGGGGAAENQGEMYINNCVICNNVSGEYGGAINNFSQANDIKLYMINSTVAGNLTTASAGATRAGGIALRIGHKGGKGEFYAINDIICNNWHYNMTSHQLTQSDIRVGERYNADDDDLTENFIVYNAIGQYSEAKAGLANTVTNNNVYVTPEDQDVFLSYYSSSRVYQWDEWTQCEVDTGSLKSAPNDPNALYTPIRPNGAAVVDTDGVTTYFDYSDWKTGSVKMAYAANDGELQQIGALGKAGENDLVATFYESDIVPDTITRTIGIMGADGWTTDEVNYYKLRLIEEPVNGDVANITVYGRDYPAGTEVTVLATPDFACTFLGWYEVDGDGKDVLVSQDAAYTVVLGRNIGLKAKFSPPGKTEVFMNIICEQEAGRHGTFELTLTTNWLGRALASVCPDGVITDGNRADVEAALNAPDEENGLNHVWMNYVLGGMMPGDPNGRIWIRADQTIDKETLRFRMQELATTKSCGFTVKYRLNKKPADKETYSRGGYAESGSFEDKVTLSDYEHRVIDLIFIPDGYLQSEEYVTTVNTAGVIKVESSKKAEILASPWAGFSPFDNPAVKATDYVKASCLTTNDVLYVYDRENTNYVAWTVKADGTWKSVKTYLLANGGITDTTDATRTNAIPRGAGAWLERHDVTKPIYLYGQVDGSSVTTRLESGFNLIGSPLAAPFDLRTIPAPADKGVLGDHIAIPTGAEPINIYYVVGKGWAVQKSTVTVLNPGTDKEMRLVSTEWDTESESLTIPLGHGFWYYNKNSNARNLDWTPTAK